MKNSIPEFLMKNNEEGYSSFHMPGHKGSAIYREFGYEEWLNQMMDCDVTEIIGADNLFKAEGIIGKAQERWARLYDVRKSYLLVNGTSGGIIAAIMAAAPKGSELIMARNCHKSVFNSLQIADLSPVYAYPEIIPEYGVTGAVAPEEIERLLKAHPAAAAVVLPSPNYYGVCSDIRSIAKIVHEYGKILIVDQAHGAHLHFFNKAEYMNPDFLKTDAPVPGFGPSACTATGMPDMQTDISVQVPGLSPSACTATGSDAKEQQNAKLDTAKDSVYCYASGKFSTKTVSEYPAAAEDCGADIVINSVHKTLASYTQSAVLNLCSRRVSEMILEDKLQMIESSSPSYILMGSLDIAADMIETHGATLLRRWDENLNYAYDRLGRVPGLKVMQVPGMDRTKINLDMSMLGLDAGELELRLLDRKIRCELTTGNILMCMTGIGNSRRDFDRLCEALEDISSEILEKQHNLQDISSIVNKRCDMQPGLADKAPAGESKQEASIANKRCDMQPSLADESLAKRVLSTELELFPIPAHKEVIELKDAANRICAGSIIPYPPGIPLVCPGERITAEIVAYVEELITRNEKVIGVSGDMKILVGAV